MKRCRTCQQEKPLEAFYRNVRCRDGRLNHCKVCFGNTHRESRAERAKANRALIARIKVERGCTDCGYSANPVALDFDHLPGTEKLYRISTMADMRKDLIEAEIAKCEVVCANCHRIRTSDRLTAAAAFTP